MTASNHVVSLEEVLVNREARVVRQRGMLDRGNGAIISFTVNMPGPVKDTADARVIFRAGLDALAAATRDAGFAVGEQRELYLPTGPEALLGFAAEAMAVKRMAVAVENTHPLGRLFDMDVLDASGASISRAALGAPMRTCLVCGGKAAVCGRSRAHAMDELLAAIRKQVAAYTAGD
ncbi:citrate lyase holo-[acyl-carrier protein] synthase [Desulfovibrio sp. OttesenSCG-928-O18]|nr:citrate lyase holo-[acyl-carrier protein] synthase [Desulfovibrio sp. OttesenSCG-928-O18]